MKPKWGGKQNQRRTNARIRLLANRETNIQEIGELKNTKPVGKNIFGYRSQEQINERIDYLKSNVKRIEKEIAILDSCIVNLAKII